MTPDASSLREGLMKITAVEVAVLRHRLSRPFGFSQWWYDTRACCLVRIETDAGLVGWGECYGPPEPIKAVIDTVYTPLILLGADPFDNEALWERMYNRMRDYGQKGVAVAAISGVDIALWDLKGKATGLPVCKLLGGLVRDTVQAYATGLYFTETADLPSALAAEAVGYVEQGFRAIKMKVGLGIAADRANARAVRAAIGPEIALMADANHAFDAKQAIRLGRALEEVGAYWFEEPVPPEDIAGYIEVKAALDLAIAGGEAEFTRWGFRDLLSRRAVDIVQPDTCNAGGLTECKRIMALASAFGVQYMPHVWGSAVGLAANLHLAASVPDNPPSLHPTPLLFEFDRTENRFRDELAHTPITHLDGSIAVPTGPGLGIEIDERVIERYRVL
jgi:D-galactarolactone cycloisomerase